MLPTTKTKQMKNKFNITIGYNMGKIVTHRLVDAFNIVSWLDMCVWRAPKIADRDIQYQAPDSRLRQLAQNPNPNMMQAIKF